MGKFKAATILSAVAWLVSQAAAIAGDPPAVRERGWWTPSRLLVPLYSVDSLNVTPSMSPDAILANLPTALLPDSLALGNAPTSGRAWISVGNRWPAASISLSSKTED